MVFIYTIYYIIYTRLFIVACDLLGLWEIGTCIVPGCFPEMAYLSHQKYVIILCLFSCAPIQNVLSDR